MNKITDLLNYVFVLTEITFLSSFSYSFRTYLQMPYNLPETTLQII